MLIAKIYVNEKQIDEIVIQNTGEIQRGFYEYLIKKPEGYDDEPIMHKRSAGYHSLLIMALNLIGHRKKVS